MQLILCNLKHVNYFRELLVTFPFVTLDANFVSLLQYRFQRQAQPGILTDIYDGAVYRQLSSFLEQRFNISFALNYDGAPVFKSSSMQIWPVQLYVNELPPHVR